MTVRALIAAACLVFLVGCNSPDMECPDFARGEVVKHRILDGDYLILSDRAFSNIYTGECSVTVRASNGSRGAISLFELEL